ncbi:MAG: RraA family protein [Bryobacteraceae bacterium]
MTRTILCLLVAASLLTPVLTAQVFSFTRERMIAYTADNPFDRFPDGRPKVPDDLLEKVENLVIEEAYGVVRGKGFPHQYEGDWKVLQPQKRLVGRAFTVQFMPVRADVNNAMQKEADAKGTGRLRNQTAIDMLQPGDVIVVDLFGKTESGTFVGDKLAYYVWKTTGTGMVVDGGMFWLPKVRETGMPAYYRGTHPSSLGEVMLTGINVPVRIGQATVMPGDVVLGDGDGLFFIPPHLVKDAIAAAESTQSRDEWIKKKFDERKYKSSDLYGRPRDPALLKELEEYQKSRRKQ